MLVESVDLGGAAGAGIMPGDVITGRKHDSQQWTNIMLEIRNAKPGETLMIEIFEASYLNSQLSVSDRQ